MTERSEMVALADKLEFAASNTEGCLYSQRKMLNAAAQALRSAARTDADAGYGAGFEAAPLAWNEYEREGEIDEWDAETFFGTFYGVKRHAFCFMPYYDSSDIQNEGCQTPDEAKAICQSDYTKRLQAAIAALPAPPGESVTVTIPVDVAQVIVRAFLPINPNKMRSAAPETIEAAKAFKQAVEAFTITRKSDGAVMSDLIWVGNTLYPRWFVFAVAGAVILLLVILWTLATEPRS